MPQAQLPDRIAHGFLAVDGLLAMQLGKVRCYQYQPFQTGFTLFSPDEQTSVYVQMYQTPAGADQLNDDLQFQTLRQEPQSKPNIPHSLNIFPADWAHYAFAVSKGRIVHLYDGPGRAVFIRYSARDMNDQRFTQFNQHVRFLPDAWHTELVNQELLPNYAELMAEQQADREAASRPPQKIAKPAPPPGSLLASLAKIEPKARTTAPATQSQIAAAEQAVGVKFPADVRGLFLETNGILDDLFGPVLPLTSNPTSQYSDSHGNLPRKKKFPGHDYSMTQYTLLQRQLWQDDAGISHDNFVVLGLDCGGNPYGFFAGQKDTAQKDAAQKDTVRIQCIAHDEGSIEPAEFTLEEYLRHYFKECRWFDDEQPGAGR